MPTPIEPTPANRKVGPPGISDWAVLERFTRELQNCNQTIEALGFGTQAIREVTGADSVFVFSEATSKAFAVVSNAEREPGYWGDQARRLVAKHGPGADEAICAAARPDTVLLVRIPQSRAWIIALIERPDAQFDSGQLAFVRLVRQMVLSHHAQMQSRLKDMLTSLIHCLTATIDAKDPYTAGHSERVARIGVLMGKQMQLSAPVVSDIYLAGLLHDVGKIGIRDEVLQKSGALTEPEYAHIQEHVVIGEKIVSSIRQFDRLRAGVRSHHERFDGKGYPDGITGDAIPLLARILAVADACDAMMSPRRYRPARTPPEIDAIFRETAGRQFDPEVLEHFMACRNEIYPPIYQKGIGESAFHAVGHIVDNLGESSWARVPPITDIARNKRKG